MTTRKSSFFVQNYQSQNSEESQSMSQSIDTEKSLERDQGFWNNKKMISESKQSEKSEPKKISIKKTPMKMSA